MKYLKDLKKLEELEFKFSYPEKEYIGGQAVYWTNDKAFIVKFAPIEYCNQTVGKHDEGLYKRVFHVDFSGAEFRNVKFIGFSFKNCNFSHTIFRLCEFYSCVFDNCKFFSVNMENKYLSFKKCTLKNMDFNYMKEGSIYIDGGHSCALYNVSFKDSLLRKISFKNISTINNIDLTNYSMIDILSFKNCILYDSRLNKKDYKRASLVFFGSSLYNCYLPSNILGSRAGLYNTDLKDCDISGHKISLPKIDPKEEG